jgi:non-ribosomal peptide synthetase component F
MKPSPYTVRYSPREIDDYYRSGVWTAETFHDLLVRRVKENPDKVFATDGTRSLTFRELFDSGQRLAVGLHRRGLRRGDKAAVQLPNWVEFIEVLTALSRLGVIMVPIMPIYRREDVGYVLSNAGVRAVFTPAQFSKFDYLDMYRVIRQADPELMIVVARSDSAADDVADVFTLDQLQAEVDDDSASAELGEPPNPDDPFVIVYTSGTTSRLHRDRRSVRPLPYRPHHRARHQRAAADVDRGGNTSHGQVGSGPWYRGDPALRLHCGGNRPDLPARLVIGLQRRHSRPVHLAVVDMCGRTDRGCHRRTGRRKAADDEGAQPVRAQ